jgi:geranylgeranyl reductase family protein
MLDTVVVGGGPAGLYCALRLAEAGFDVAVVEEHEALGVPTHCTGLVSDEVWDLFKVPDAVVLSRPAQCLVVSPDGRTFRFDRAGERIAVIDRGEFDRELGAAAQRAGAEIKVGVRAADVAVESARVRVTPVHGAILVARSCVIACGVAYGLQRRLGLGLPARFLHSAQVELDAAVAESTVEIHLGRATAPEGFAWIVPVVRGGVTRAKAGIMMRGDAASQLQRFVAGRRLAAHGSLLSEALRRVMPVGPASPTYAHRVLTAGDAAGLTKPTTGGGIFYSLLSGRLAAETLVEALRDDRLSRQDLRIYEGRWRAHLGPHLELSGHLRRLFSRLADQEIERLMAALAAADIQAVIRQTARFNWHGEVIRAVLRQPGITSLLFQTLLR